MTNRVRNRSICFRCTDREYQEITEKISVSGKTATDFLILTLREKEIVVIPKMQEVLGELTRQGINLNQALRYAHSEKRMTPQLREAICNCNQLYRLYLATWKDSKGA